MGSEKYIQLKNSILIKAIGGVSVENEVFNVKLLEFSEKS